MLKNSKFLKREQDLSPGSSESLPSGNGQVLFKDYLKQQIDHLMTGDAGRDGVAEGRRGTHVEVPSCRLWARVSLVLFEFFMTPKSDLIAPLTTMASHLDLDMKFSEARCRKAIPVATSAYLEGLPSHYTQNVHLNQLSQALRVFSLHARGPAFEHYAAQFQDESNKVWMNGRQLCEERSLTGRHCVYPYHRVPADGEPPSDPVSEESKDLGIIPCKPHSSRITSLCACNCGRMQDHREDPFDLKAANVDFYQILEKKCCTSLVHLLFPLHPIFSFATTSNQAANEPAGDSPVLETTSDTGDPPGEEVVSGGGISDDQQANQGSDGEQVASPIVTTTAAVPIPNASKSGRAATVESQGHRASSTYGSSGYQSTLDMMSHEGPEFRSITSEFKSVVSLGIPGELSTVGSEDVFSATDNAQGKGSDDMLSRQLTEKEQVFLETMLTTESPAGLYPRFPSWSLCRVGGSGGYNPAKGLEQPGFFPNSNFLLAWDIPLLNDSQSDLTSQFDVQGTHFGSKQMTEEAWPTLNELPSASGTTLSSLPLYQALTYARRQSADYKGNAPPLVSSSNSGKGSASSSRQRGRATREGVVPTVRAYIGEEYECPRGHRFICSGPDKMVKATSSGHVKETAHKLVTSDMPLYFPCPCRSSKPLMAQMMRVFVVTPDSPVLVTLNPRVQPSIPPCPVFYPGIAAGLSLPPASFCVLRLPYVYVGDDGPVLPPADSQPLLSCRVLKGMFSAMGHIQDNAKGNAMEAKR